MSFLLQKKPFYSSISTYYNITQYPTTDYRSIATYQFQLLAALCQLSNSTFIATLEQLATEEFVNALLLSPLDFDDQITSLIDQLRQTMATSFVTSLRLVRTSMHANALFSISSSNWHFYHSTPIPESIVRTEPVIYGMSTVNCSCTLTPLCVQPATIDNITLPDLMVGCFPLESLLQSTLELLYNQTLVNFLANSSSATFTALASTTTNRYQPNTTTVESMLSQLMVQQWEAATNLTSCKNYYAQCSPSSCTFTNIGRQSLLINITSLISFAGGLSVGLNIIIPSLIHLVQLVKQRRPRIHPAVK